MKPQPSVVHGWNGLYLSTNQIFQDGRCGLYCPYGVRGDRLWVKETFLLANAGASCYCRADQDSIEAAGFGAMYGGWKPSIFMPRKWSRITLEIVRIRVERLREISTDDAESEGAIVWWNSTPAGVGVGKPILHPKAAFEALWKSINGDESWNSNLWVWVIEFKRL